MGLEGTNDIHFSIVWNPLEYMSTEEEIDLIIMAISKNKTDLVCIPRKSGSVCTMRLTVGSKCQGISFLFSYSYVLFDFLIG